jgi:NitT/TauT family transport system ATP-binding protein
MSSLQARNVSMTFQTRRGSLHALDDVTLEIPDAHFTCLVGASGCGKSTLLNIMAGLIEPTAGDVLVDGHAIDGPGADRGMVFQSYTLYPWMTVRRNIEFGPKLKGVGRAARGELSGSLIAEMGLEGFADSYPKELSGGMKQRVAIARALANDPQLLLMDEPFGALDAHTRTRLQNDLLNIWERDRKTVLFVTHSVDEAVFLSDRVVVMTRSPGRIKQIVDIDLPRPRRRAELLLDPRYQKYVVELERLIDDTGIDELHP